MQFWKSACFALLVTRTLAIDPKLPKWLSNKGFRVTGETRLVLQREYYGVHNCTSETDQFPTTDCVDKANFRRVVHRHCGACRKTGTDTPQYGRYSTTFCSENPIDGVLYTGYAEYDDDQCQKVCVDMDPVYGDLCNFTGAMEALPINPTCFTGNGGSLDCSAECMGPRWGRGTRGCDHIGGKDRAMCESDSVCHWNDPAIISFYSQYWEFGEYTPAPARPSPAPPRPSPAPPRPSPGKSCSWNSDCPAGQKCYVSADSTSGICSSSPPWTMIV